MAEQGDLIDLRSESDLIDLRSESDLINLHSDHEDNELAHGLHGEAERPGGHENQEVGMSQEEIDAALAEGRFYTRGRVRKIDQAQRYDCSHTRESRYDPQAIEWEPYRRFGTGEGVMQCEDGRGTDGYGTGRREWGPGRKYCHLCDTYLCRYCYQLMAGKMHQHRTDDKLKKRNRGAALRRAARRAHMQPGQ